MTTPALTPAQAETLRLIANAGPKGTAEVHQGTARSLALRELVTTVSGAQPKRGVKETWRATPLGRRIQERSGP